MTRNNVDQEIHDTIWYNQALTHWSRVMHICVSRPSLVQIMACRLVVPSHHLNQWWNIVNWTLGNKLQSNLNRNLYIFIEENAFENVTCEMAAILSWPQSVNELTSTYLSVCPHSWWLQLEGSIPRNSSPWLGHCEPAVNGHILKKKNMKITFQYHQADFINNSFVVSPMIF